LKNDTEKSENWTIPLTGVADGVWWLDIMVADRVGNSDQVNGVVFIVDRKNPDLVWDNNWTPGFGANGFNNYPSDPDQLDLEKMYVDTAVNP